MNVEFRGQTPSDVKVTDSAGSDLSIYRSARISYGAEDKPTAERLKEFIDNLLAKGHWVPFEHCVVMYKLKAPIFVFRQLFRYRTASISERSLRYTKAKPEVYIPDELNNDYVWEKGNKYRDAIGLVYDCYCDMCKSGVRKEIARAILPFATFSEAYFTMDLRNLLHLFEQRIDKHAQKETRYIAERMAEEAAKLFPITMECWMEKR